MVQAIMDVCYHDRTGHHLIDVRICSPCAGDHARVLAASRRDGEAAARQVRAKIARYGDTVTPFIVEIGGRPSREAREWVKETIGETIQLGSHSILASKTWATLSCTLQRYVAIQLRKAEGKL